MNIGVLPVTVTPEFLDQIFTEVEKDPKTELTVDLPTQTITLNSTGEKETFDINDYKKNNLLNGYDDIDYLMAMKSDIETFAESRPF